MSGIGRTDTSLIGTRGLDAASDEPAPVGERQQAAPAAEGTISRLSAGPRPLDLQAAQLLARLEQAEGSQPSWLGFADSSRNVRNLAEKVAADGHVSPAEVEELVTEAKDFDAISGSEREVLTKLLAERPQQFAPAARVALARFLGVEDPLAGQDGRNAPGPAYGTPEFERLLDRDTGSVARGGNQVDLLFDGVQSFAERNRLIADAKDSIHLQTFIFTADDTGWELARLLAKKADEGVKVRVIYDGLGSNRSGTEIFDFMKSHGVEVREYGDPLRQFWDLNNRWHEKHLVVDGQVSIEGGMNIADEYAFGGSGRMVLGRGEGGQGAEPWRDADVRLEGPAVHDAQAAFLKNWADLGAPVSEAERGRLFPPPQIAADGTRARVVQHRPDEDGDEHTHKLYLHAIRSAEKSIVIENAYFIPPDDVREALLDAAKRGVDVRVMTNSRASNDMGIVSDASRYFYDELMAAGVRIYEKHGGTLHSKTATFDGELSIVGSVNMNGRSEGLDSESAIVVEDPSTAAALERRFTDGIAQTKEVTSAELRDESFFTNLKQWGLSLFSWTF